jgi:hypothetical protein
VEEVEHGFAFHLDPMAQDVTRHLCQHMAQRLLYGEPLADALLNRAKQECPVTALLGPGKWPLLAGRFSLPRSWDSSPPASAVGLVVPRSWHDAQPFFRGPPSCSAAAESVSPGSASSLSIGCILGRWPPGTAGGRPEPAGPSLTAAPPVWFR